MHVLSMKASPNPPLSLRHDTLGLAVTSKPTFPCQPSPDVSSPSISVIPSFRVAERCADDDLTLHYREQHIQFSSNPSSARFSRSLYPTRLPIWSRMSVSRLFILSPSTIVPQASAKARCLQTFAPQRAPSLSDVPDGLALEDRTQCCRNRSGLHTPFKSLDVSFAINHNTGGNRHCIPPQINTEPSKVYLSRLKSTDINVYVLQNRGCVNGESQG
jgi:hypothetical protein